MDKYKEFLNNNGYKEDPTAKKRLQDLQDLYIYATEEVNRIVNFLNSKKIDEQSIIDKENRLIELNSIIPEKESIINEKEQIILNRKQIIIDLDNIIKNKEIDIKTRKDLTEEICLLKEEKDNIIEFNNINKVEKNELDYLRNQASIIKQEILKLEQERSGLARSITNAEIEKRKFDLNLQEPKQILEKNKEILLAIETTKQANEKLLEEMNNKPGSIGEYIRKIQKKYPDLDLLNI